MDEGGKAELSRGARTVSAEVRSKQNRPEQQRDRRTTSFTRPFMHCRARFPLCSSPGEGCSPQVPARDGKPPARFALGVLGYNAGPSTSTPLGLNVLIRKQVGVRV